MASMKVDFMPPQCHVCMYVCMYNLKKHIYIYIMYDVTQ